MFTAKKSFTAIIVFTAFSLVMSVLWIILGAPDLAITEAAVGAGITSLLFYVALKNMDEIKEKQADLLVEPITGEGLEPIIREIKQAVILTREENTHYVPLVQYVRSILA